MFFPSAHRSHPEVKDLYRAYLNSRHHVRSKVRRNIEIEVRRNPFHLDQLPTQPAETGASSLASSAAAGEDVYLRDDDDDMDIEDVDKSLTLDQAIQELALAERIFKKEIRTLETDCNNFAKEFQNLDSDMEALKLPGKSTTGVDELELMKELQELLELSTSIMGSSSSKP
ncbi:hypothetical protein BGZ83_004746 [Gryganskiella cystojenkinii]|nr:hypothetical protein BGZ83_004746 [Gryganskiella cystojenkinii]